MDTTGRTFVKWTLAIIVLAGVVVYAINEIPDAFSAGFAFGGESETATAQASTSPSADAGGGAVPTGPVANGVSTPTVDFALTAGNVVSEVASDGMTVGDSAEAAIVVSFPLIEGSPDCVQSARLELPVRNASPTEFAVYPSSLPDPATLADGAAAPGDPVIAVDGPPLSFTNGTPGRLTWEVGDLYRTWASGGQFPGGAAPPAGTDRFTLVVKPTGVEAGREVTFASSETGESGPTLAWTGLAGCGGA